MSRGTILITGATGFLGSAILIAALKADYSAHVVVRSDSKAEFVKSSLSRVLQIQSAPPSPSSPSPSPSPSPSLQLSSNCKYFIVPDLTVPGSLDEAARGADYVIHGASPLPFVAPPDRQYAEIIAPAVGCTLSVLNSARRSESVKRVVAISSIGAFVTPQLIFPTAHLSKSTEEDVTITEKCMNEYLDPPFPDLLTAYCAAKTAALKRSIEWMRDAVRSEEGVQFDLVNLAPVYVFGRQPFAREKEELLTTSNAMLLRSAVSSETPSLPGRESEGPLFECGGGIHIDDVVSVHLAALDKDSIKTPDEGLDQGIETFAFGTNVLWDGINEAVAKMWPIEVEKGVLPNKGNFFAKPYVKYQAERVERTFGIKFKGFEEMLRDVVTQYLEVVAEKKI